MSEPVPAAGAARPGAALPVFLGRYETERVLGRGQMGEVLQVCDRVTGARFALKRIPPELARDASQFDTVRANFELVRGLDHPHIAGARALEVDPRTGEAFLLLDLVPGSDLAAWLARRRKELGGPAAPLPTAEVVGLAEQIAAALDHAHARPVGDGTPGGAQGILHRDLKPANVMAESGREFPPGVPFVRLVDFGLAAEIQASLLSLSKGPPTGKSAGTPVYMAPEQWEGRTLTRGVDQWSLAVMIYEMLAGRRPFQAPDLYMLREQVLRTKPDPPPRLAPEAWRALARGLTVDRRARHPSCLALVYAIAAADPAHAGTMTTPVAVLPAEFADSDDGGAVEASPGEPVPPSPAGATLRAGRAPSAGATPADTPRSPRAAHVEIGEMVLEGAPLVRVRRSRER